EAVAVPEARALAHASLFLDVAPFGTRLHGGLDRHAVLQARAPETVVGRTLQRRTVFGGQPVFHRVGELGFGVVTRAALERGAVHAAALHLEGHGLQARAVAADQ